MTLTLTLIVHRSPTRPAVRPERESSADRGAGAARIASPVPDDADPPTEVADVRMSDDDVVEWFDGTGWKPYRELSDPKIPPVWVFRGSSKGGGRMAEPPAANPETAAPEAPTSTRTDPLPSPLDAVPDTRATARWTIGAVSAVGALLVGGAPLTAVGRIDDVGDLLAIAGGMLIVIVSLGWAVWQTAEALTPALTTVEILRDRRLSDLRAQVARSPSTYFGPFGDTWDGLARGLQEHRRVAVNLRAGADQETDSHRRGRWTAALAAAEANVALAEQLMNRLAALVHVWRIRAAVRRARSHTLLAMIGVSVGAILILTATADNPGRGHPADRVMPGRCATASPTQSR